MTRSMVKARFIMLKESLIILVSGKMALSTAKEFFITKINNLSLALSIIGTSIKLAEDGKLLKVLSRTIKRMAKDY